MRLLIGATLTALAIVLGAAVVPVTPTLASFTDSETAVASPSITAGTLGSATISGCSVDGSQLALAWTTAPGTIAGDGYLVRFVGVLAGGVVDFPVASGAQSTRISVNSGQFQNNTDYRVSVLTQLSSAPGWTSAEGTTVMFRKGSNGAGNPNTCR
ncbi:hypothetical protein AB4Y63_06330 [Leifsonia sp. YAF41]|uniref:hypothetical protein n=1 Tax=Leifsonia sp. YAF41 TaxID=3233086 RepID=UPI003F95AD6D